MPSDFYQARAIAQFAIRFNWTWIGAVAINTNYGTSAIKVFLFVLIFMRDKFVFIVHLVFMFFVLCTYQIFQDEIERAGACLAFTEILNRENIVNDARRAALTIQASTAKVILVFAWYTDVWELFRQLAMINVRS